MPFRDRIDDRQPQATAGRVFRVARGLATMEAIEQVGQFVGRHAGSRVLDRQPRRDVALPDTDIDGAAARRVLDRVVDQIADQHAERLFVARDPHRFGLGQAQVDGPVGGEVRQRDDGVAGDRVEIDRIDLDRIGVDRCRAQAATGAAALATVILARQDQQLVDQTRGPVEPIYDASEGDLHARGR